ncbi:hypothetical protein Asp14428_08550 [Actinoplanes sp. NBRC 14428]|nr:hypothetical protein Asp14428_08550 [Actinoplanes sp. NBRC 14428]
MATLRPHGAEALAPVADDDAGGAYFARTSGGPLTVYDLPAGHLLTEGLTGVLAASGRSPLWLRLRPEDNDPAAFLRSLAQAAGRYRPGCAEATLALMRKRPGPAYGWPPLFDRLTADLADVLADKGTLVLEHAHRLRGPGVTLDLLGSRVLPGLRRRGVPCVLFAFPGLDPTGLPADAARWTTRDLRRPAPGARRRTRWEDAAGARAAARAVRTALGPAAEDGLSGASGVDDLMLRAAGLLVPLLDDRQRRRLGMATALEYGRGEPAGPWWQRLDDGWFRLRAAWSGPLSVVLAPSALPGPRELRRAADALLRDGELDRAVGLYLEAHEEEAAAKAIDAHAADLMDLGRWQTLEEWTARLPADVLAGHPDLLHDRGEIAAVRGDAPAAHRWFDLAATRYLARADPGGAGRSMLAASSVAVAADDLPTARARSSAAVAFAEAGTEPGAVVWPSWQQATTALLSGDTDTALVCFTRAAGACPAGSAPELIRSAGALSRQIDELRRRQEGHRTAALALRGRENEVLGRLLAAVGSGPSVPGLPGTGWSAAPIPLRLRGLNLGRPADAGRGLGARLRRALTGHRTVPAPQATHGETGPAGAGAPAPGRPGPMLVVELMGPFRAAVDDVAVHDGMGPRIRSLLAYLVTHREPWPSGEAIADALRPGTAREAGRNSLNVALHGLRRALREGTGAPVVVFAGSSYRLHPTVTLWVDVDRFEERIARARADERGGDDNAAVAAYEDATGLYRGEFLADEPYEEWPSALRRGLRLRQLDALDRLARLHFGQGRYARAADLVLRLLEEDPCREEAHRLLMRCHSRRGLPHLALLQFRTCVRTLGAELSIEPAAETVDLYRAIRRHDPV